MRREEICEGAFALVDGPASRVGDTEVRDPLFYRLGGRGRGTDLFEGRGERERVARQLRSRGVGQVLALARDSHRDELRDERREDDRDDPEEEEDQREKASAGAVPVAGTPTPASPPETAASPVGDEQDGADERGHDR